MRLGPHPPLLVGRTDEMHLISSLVDDLPDSGGALVVRGDAGIGKSALLAWSAQLATDRGFRVLRAGGVESEAQVAFAGLEQLLRPVMPMAHVLASPQRAALLAALGRTDATAPDAFLIALAALNLLADAAVRAPVLLLIEDAHWLDRASSDALAFVARRLNFEPMAMIVAIRDGTTSALGSAALPELALAPLTAEASGELLDAGFPRLGPAVRERILAVAAGNPLALVELPVSLDTGPGSSRPWLSLPRRLQEAFVARAVGLPAVTAALLLVAALNDGDSLSETLAATAFMDVGVPTVDDVAPAVDARLIDLSDDHLTFRHPLVRSAILQRAAVGRHRQGHAALARVLEAETERRAWHRGASAIGPDENIAIELATAGARAQRRGGIDAAATAFERAAQLSTDPLRRGIRLLRAADLAVELGQHDTVVRLLHQAESLDLSGRQQTHVTQIRAVFDDGIRDMALNAPMLAEEAERVAADGEIDLAMKLLWGASLRCYFAEPGTLAREQVVAAAERVCTDPDDPRLVAILGFVAPVERGADIIDRLPRAMHKVGRDPADSRLVGNAALAVGAFDIGLAMHTTAIVGLRAQGRLALLARSLSAQAWCALNLIDLGTAISAAEEGVRLAEETSQPNIRVLSRAHESVISALRGDHDLTERIAAEVERDSLPVGVRPALAVVQFARGLSGLGEGRYSDAYEHLRRVYDPADPAFHVSRRCYFVGELVEAALRSGRRHDVTRVVAEMESVGRQTPSPALHIGLRYARAMLAEDSLAEQLYHLALYADLTRWPYARARAQLGYGEWLRRQRRVAESRPHLRTARETFDALGVVPWGDRARLELRASGETSRGREPEARDALTPQELQIAEMAAEGLTNREIGQKLYLSHRTVSTHLHRIFPKLGITARSALSAALHPLR